MNEYKYYSDMFLSQIIYKVTIMIKSMKPNPSGLIWQFYEYKIHIYTAAENSRILTPTLQFITLTPIQNPFSVI